LKNAPVLNNIFAVSDLFFLVYFILIKKPIKLRQAKGKKQKEK